MKRELNRITPFMVMDILKRARTLPEAVHMEIGEPDLPPSEKVIEAYERAIRDKQFHYTSAKGLPELRERIAEHYLRSYNREVSPERIIITPGTSGAFLIVFALVGDRGRIALTDPSYPCYKNFCYFLGIEPRFIKVDSSTNYQITTEMLKATNGLSAIVISSPSNPTGSIYDKKRIEELTRFSGKRGLWLISDEIYHGLNYDEPVHTALEFSERAIVINGFSKYFCMPGFRLGWMILPQELVREAEIIAQNIFIAANTPAQYAALEAFDYPYLEKVRETFRIRRDYLYESLKDLFTIDVKPEGAFYIWADISRYGLNCLKFSDRLLQEKAVAITPGVDFGSYRTDRYVRFAYTTTEEQLKEGVSRIKDFVDNL